MCSGVVLVRRAGFLLIWVVWICVVASPGWAVPRFGRPGAYTVDGAPVGIRAATIDSKSGRDLVTANEAGVEGPSLSILINRGNGSFFPQEPMTVNAAKYIVQAIASGDFNADGRDDLAVAVDDISVFPPRAAVLVYLNTGSGDFAEPVDVRLSGFFPRAIEAADVTGDGALDLLVVHAQSGAPAAGLVSLLSGQRSGGTPTGAFSVTESSPVGSTPSALSVGDLDGDTHLDVAVTDQGGGAVYLLYGTGMAGDALAPPVEVMAGATPIAALIDALPGAVLPQLLVGTRSGGKLLRFAQTAPRVFAAPSEQRIGFVPVTMGLAELTGDDVEDFVLLSALGADLWVGAADGSFSFGESIIAGDDALSALTLADLNGDATIDVAASATIQDRVVVALNGADVPLTPSPTPTITPTSLRTATASPTPTGDAGACAGDCDGDAQVSINELIQGVNIALGNVAVASCAAFDRDGNGQVTVNELIAAVNNALGGCPSA